ncbi:hypothetical protein ACKWTF_013398 [Chironomus riparius]
MEMIVAYIAIILMFVSVPCICFKLIGYCFYSGGDNKTKFELDLVDFESDSDTDTSGVVEIDLKIPMNDSNNNINGNNNTQLDKNAIIVTEAGDILNNDLDR